jgi:lactoylglutathione lyase
MEVSAVIETFGLSHIQLTVSNLERSLGFYQKLLGMKELFRAGAHAVMLQTPGSHEVFTLNCNPEYVDSSGKMGGIAHFGFRLKDATDMTELLEAVKRAGGTPIEHGKRGKEKDELYAFATDPDGYELEFFWKPGA